MFKRLIILLMMTILASACSQVLPISPSPTPTSGIEGHVTEGPTCPGPVPVNNSTECADKPYQATLAIQDANNKEIAKFQTDAAGYFKFSLAPGTYSIHPISENILPHAADQSVIVDPGIYTQVNIIYDTGMR